MKLTTKNLLLTLLGILFLMSAHSMSYAASKASCSKEIADFKNLYIELQKSLNYEGKDAFLNPKGALQLKDHAKGTPYEGKVFEEALYKEYQNSLRKVALMYQAAKFDDSAPADFKSNSALVDFIKAVDGDEGAKYIATNNVNSVIDGLEQASRSKYPNDSKFRINDNDKYLLKKLLTHAQDRICSIERYQLTGKKDKNFSAEELEKKKNAPLNQLILTIKDAKINKDSDIKLTDEKTAINSAIAANMNAINEWAKKNKSCVAALKANAASMQAGIQSCNYRKFIETLNSENLNNIESILHFINSNEKFKNNNPKAETALDEMKMQAYVDSTFANLGNKINCAIIQAPKNKGTKLFVRNLPYDNATGKFDTSKIECKVHVKLGKSPPTEKILSDKECALKFELVSDELGRGLEVRQKNQTAAPITFSIKDNPSCKDIELVSPQSPEPPLVMTSLKTNESCKAEGEKENPIRDLVADKDGKTCILKVTLKTDAICKVEGESEKPPRDLVADKEGKTCIVRVIVKTDAICKIEGESEKPPRDLVADKEGKTCIVRVILKTDAICKVEGESEKPPRALVADKEGKTCILKEVLKTDEICKALGEKENPKQDYIASEDKQSCIEKKKEESAAEKECRENNKKLSDENSGRPFSDWKVVKGECINTKDKTSSKQSGDNEKESKERAVPTNENFTAPPRFTPTNIPTRQMYILPGMP